VVGDKYLLHLRAQSTAVDEIVGVLLRGPDGPTNFQSEEKRRSTSWRWPYLIREGVVREESGFLGHRVDPDPVRGHKSKLG